MIYIGNIKPRLKNFLLWGLTIVGYYCWFQAFYNSIHYGSMFAYDSFSGLLVGISYNFPPILSIFLLNLLIVFRIVRVRNTTLKIVGDVVLSAVAAVAVNLMYHVIMLAMSHTPRIDWSGTILNDIIVLLMVEFVYFNRQSTEARQRALQYQYDALKAQINPHFLFNSLNLLHSLVSINPANAQVFIRELARMYRYIMAKQNADSVEVSEEFEFLKSYISVLQLRYNKKFEVMIVGTPPEQKHIIPFTLQLLIENVTKHNVISANNPMVVMITISDEGIQISNPLRPRPTPEGTGIGLTYLTRLYESKHRVFKISNDQETFTADIPYL